MRKFILFLLVILSSFFSIFVNGQGATPLRNNRGVSLSYTREFYKKCKEITNREYNIYKITVYLSNNSGKSIKMADSWVSNNNSRYLNCISEYNNFGSMTFKPSGDLNASILHSCSCRRW
jgi:nitrate/TMAO reductase-like tetraheme cytochrome c subunit